MISFKKHLKEWGEDEKNSQNIGSGNKEWSSTHILHHSLKEHYKYNDKHIHTLGGYIGGSRTLNGFLWDKYKKTGNYTDFEKSTLPKATLEIDKVINHHKAPHDLTVYSGTRHDPREHMNKEGVVHHPAYLSTSISSHIGKEFSNRNSSYPNNLKEKHNHLLQIHVPKGHPSAYGGSLPGSSLADYEREIILPRGINLKHIKTETQTVKNGYSYHNHLHHMEVI